MLSVNRAAQERAIRLGRAILSFHNHTEREEQKRIERISKERLKVLKADDEEAYMKLINCQDIPMSVSMSSSIPYRCVLKR